MSSSGLKLIQLARALERARPDMTHEARATLAVEILKADGVSLDSDGNAWFSDAARALVPTLPRTSDAKKDARLEPEARQSVPANHRSANPTAHELADDRVADVLLDLDRQLAAVKGDDDGALCDRASIHEKIVRARLGDEYVSTLEKP